MTCTTIHAADIVHIEAQQSEWHAVAHLGYSALHFGIKQAGVGWLMSLCIDHEWNDCITTSPRSLTVALTTGKAHAIMID